MANDGFPDRCKNCITPLPDGAKYCPHCGQKRINLHDHSIWHLMVESVGDFFHVNSRFFATLRPLLFRPGYLTNEFLAGRRARYFEPFKLFLFISFLYFLTSGILNHRDKDIDFETTPALAKTDTAQVVLADGNYHLTLADTYYKDISIPDDSLRKMVKKEGLNQFVRNKYPDASWWTKFMLKQVIKNRLKGSGTFNQNMAKTIPKLIFILIPFFALLLKMIYFRKKISYYNHIIFSFHFLSFFFLINIFSELTKLITSRVGMVFLLIMVLYLFYSLRNVYAEKLWPTFRKFFMFFFGSLFIVGAFFIAAAMISFFMI
jgi:hypothetical protein